MSYADRGRPPRTLTRAEQTRLLKLTGQRTDDYADHVLFALALGTGLRVFEIEALDMCDLYNKACRARTRVTLRVFKRKEIDPAPQEVMVGDALRHKLTRYRAWKKARKHDLSDNAPVFVLSSSRSGGGLRRMSRRRLSERFEKWKLKHCFDGAHSFHTLRHTFLQALYDKTRDVNLVKRAARHKDISTTTLYAQASADDVLEAVNALE